MKFTLPELRKAAALVYEHMHNKTPQIAWPQLAQLTGAHSVIVKHENHTPTGSFKLRGAVTFMDWVSRTYPNAPGICTATRGNHGQGLARTATARGLLTKIFVPYGNSVEKNAAMRGFGATVTEFGEDYDTAKEESIRVAEKEGLVLVPPFHKELVRGVSTYALELFSEHPDLDTVYVPIGGGSGICGTIIARDLLGLSTSIVAVVSDQAPCSRLSFEAGRPVPSYGAPLTIADGMAVRVPIAEAFEVYRHGVERFVTVSDTEVADSMRVYFRCTHNVAEGAGAAPLAALLQEKDLMKDRKVGVILCGGNVDTEWFREVLSGRMPHLS